MGKFFFIVSAALFLLFNTGVLFLEAAKLKAKDQRVLRVKASDKNEIFALNAGFPQQAPPPKGPAGEDPKGNNLSNEKIPGGILGVDGNPTTQPVTPTRPVTPTAPPPPPGAQCKLVNEYQLMLITRSLISFADQNNQRIPWQLTPILAKKHLDVAAKPGDYYKWPVVPGYGMPGTHGLRLPPRAGTIGGIMGIRDLKNQIGDAKHLLSPCDKIRKRANDTIRKNWKIYDTLTGQPIPHAGMSYGICFGGDAQRPDTVMVVTRNLTTRDLATAKWVGEKNKAVGISGLKAGQGQLAKADGSAVMATDADISPQGAIGKKHINARGGAIKWPTPTLMALPY